jgi:Sulfotransferase family
LCRAVVFLARAHGQAAACSRVAHRHAKNMNLTARFSHSAETLAREIYSILPFEGVRSPIFIIGCGRSGTTILGTTLAQHHQVTYLNEPRNLWFSAYPEADIWTPMAASREGKLALTEADFDSRKSHKLKRLFQFEAVKTRKPVLIEKLPINNFRLKLIHKIFPDARFIHIYRNGLEVARSMQKASEKGSWFPATPYRLDKLIEFALQGDDTSVVPALCSNFYELGLLEWRLSTEAAVGFLRSRSDDVFVELSYDELNQDPAHTISRILRFIGIDDDQRVRDFAVEKIARKTTSLNYGSLSDKEKMIGGRLLPLSMNGGEGLTRRSA